MTNYRFTKGNETNTIVLREQKVVVSASNLTDELAQIILNTPGMEHNVEPIPGHESAIETKKKEDQTGEVQLPQSIVSALIEAGIEKPVTKEVPIKKESVSTTSKPTTVKNTKGKKGKQ